MKTERGAQKYPFGRVIRFLPPNRVPDIPKVGTHVANHERFKRDELKASKSDALKKEKK